MIYYIPKEKQSCCFSQYLLRQYWIFKMATIYKPISINISASRWHTIEILVSCYMFSGSRNTTVSFRKAADSRPIGFSRWLLYKNISINISAFRWHTIKPLVSKHMFLESENTTVSFTKVTDGGYVGFSRWSLYKNLFLLIYQLLGDIRSKFWFIRMFSGSRNAIVWLRKAADGDHVGFSRWLPYKNIFLSISWHVDDIRSKFGCQIMFSRTMNISEPFRKVADDSHHEFIFEIAMISKNPLWYLRFYATIYSFPNI